MAKKAFVSVIKIGKGVLGLSKVLQMLGKSFRYTGICSEAYYSHKFVNLKLELDEILK
jgi:hypothetical protein